jgi:ABC-2 type transport system ATP-binding protein
MEEAESLCDSIAVMDRGRIVAQGTLPELRALVGQRDAVRLTGFFPPEAVRAALASVAGVEVVQAEEDTLMLAVSDASHRLPALFAAVAGGGGEVRGTTLTQASLESLFIKLTGKELRE